MVDAIDRQEPTAAVFVAAALVSAVLGYQRSWAIRALGLSIEAELGLDQCATRFRHRGDLPCELDRELRSRLPGREDEAVAQLDDRPEAPEDQSRRAAGMGHERVGDAA